jgi:uncharacterized protein (TIGR02301 family)
LKQHVASAWFSSGAIRVMALVLCVGGVEAAPKSTDAKANTPAATGTAPEPASKPVVLPIYFPDLLDLSETLGGLVALASVCKTTMPTSAALRVQAAELIEAEGPLAELRGPLVGRFNRGFSSHAFAHPMCTASSRLLMDRQLERARLLTAQLSTRFKG